MQLAIVEQNYIATVKSGFKRMPLYFSEKHFVKFTLLVKRMRL